MRREPWAAATRVLTREYETPPGLRGGVYDTRGRARCVVCRFALDCAVCADTGLAGPRELMLHRLFETNSQHTHTAKFRVDEEVAESPAETRLCHPLSKLNDRK